MSNMANLNPYHVSLDPQPHLDGPITDYLKKKAEEAKKKVEDIKNAAKDKIAKKAQEIHQHLTNKEEGDDKDKDKKKQMATDNPFFVTLSCPSGGDDNLHQQEND